MKLTEHFTFEEMTFSEKAVRTGIKNTPDEEQTENLKALCEDVLEKLRVLLNSRIKITSGFRNKIVNQLVGGTIVPPSQHLKGEAVDCIARALTVKEFYKKVKELVKAGKIEVDQCILEYNSWVHISYTRRRKNRNMFLIKDHSGYYND